MKAIRRQVKPRAAHPRSKVQLRAHAVYMYKLHKELEPGRGRSVRLAQPFILRRVGLEAARLSTFNRRRIITSRELGAAVQRVSHRRNAVPTDGA